MPRFQWKSRKFLGIVASLVVLYFTIGIQNYTHKASVFLKDVHPSDAWEFVADFSNMKKLNPTITDFNIIDESGNYDHWKYTAEYTELLSHWPHFANVAMGHFDVKFHKKTETYVINSVHKTCFLLGLICLNSESEFAFKRGNDSTGCLAVETIKYQCPALLSSFCRREVVFQRSAIMRNFKNHFINKSLKSRQ